MIMLKSDFPIVHLVLIDAAEAPLVRYCFYLAFCGLAFVPFFLSSIFISFAPLYPVLTKHQVAEELAAAQIPVIFTRARAAPDAWEKKDVVDGPPLTTSGVSLLKKAGVKFGISINGFSTFPCSLPRNLWRLFMD